MNTVERNSRQGSGPGGPAWAAGAVRVAAVLALTVLTGLVVAALAPQAAGFSAHVVVSGSMAPRVNAGDVVLTQPVTAAELRPGQVLLFDDPSRPGGLLLHRLVSFDDAGHLVTRGDANQSADSVHVAPADVQGLARLRVPWVGLPALWRAEGRFGAIALAAVTLAGAAVFVSRGLPRRSGAPADAPDQHTVGRHRSSAPPERPMTGTRPSAVTPQSRTPIVEEEHSASSAGYVLPPVPPPAVRRPAVRRPDAAGVPGARLAAVGAHGDCFDGGRYCGQPRR